MLSSLYTGSRDEAIQNIVSIYQSKGFAIVSFLYFANAMKRDLSEPDRQESTLAKAYAESLEKSDILLADGIALQVFSHAHGYARPPNLNGTDFNPYLFTELAKQGTVSIYLLQCYDPRIGKDETRLQKGVDAIERTFPEVRVVRAEQLHYPDRDQQIMQVMNGFAEQAKNDDSDFKVFFNCTGTPFQEVRDEKMRNIRAETGMIVLNAGGTIDFLSGYETRAPDRVVRMRIFETFWRICTNPEKNLKKFLVMFGVVGYMRRRMIHFLGANMSSLDGKEEESV